MPEIAILPASCLAEFPNISLPEIHDAPKDNLEAREAPATASAVQKACAAGSLLDCNLPSEPVPGSQVLE